MTTSSKGVNTDFTIIRIVQCNYCFASTVIKFGQDEEDAFRDVTHYRFCPKFGEKLTLFGDPNAKEANP